MRSLPQTFVILAALAGLVSGCEFSSKDATEPNGAPGSEAAVVPAGDALASNDSAPAGPADSEARPVMQAQVVLDRLGFTPGVVDGRMGLSTRNAIAGFQEANGLPETGELDDATRQKLSQWSTIPATRVITIPEEFARGPFMPVPKEPAEQAKLPTLGYASLEEKLAERFHTTPDALRVLNPGGVPAGQGGAQTAPDPAATAMATGQAQPPKASSKAPPTLPPLALRAGQQIRVPNVGADRIDPGAVKDDADWLTTLSSLGVSTDQPKVERIEVSKSKGVLKAYDKDDKLVAAFTATMGSEHDPLPIGKWKINGVSRNPKFHYNPALFWDASPGDKKATLPPGPNGPVGVVWIDLSKPHYGIHGTPAPETIGRAESHGCVRLTNWDAARLAQMVHAGTEVLFKE